MNTEMSSNKVVAQVAPPPKKKTKTTKAAQAGQLVPKSRRRKNLSTLLDVPLDVLFEVFGHLTPKDLVNVSKTTKTLRATLLDKSATTVWKASRQCSGGPDPPRDISEPQWAILIFTTACTSCGVNNVQTIDFLLRRRMCKKCKQQNLILRTRVMNEYPGVGSTIWKLVSSTSDDGSFWRPDLDHVSGLIKGYETRIAQGDQSAEVEMTKFKEGRIEHVTEIHRDLTRYTPWIVEANRQKMTKKHTLVQERIKTAKDRFRQLGYLDSDMGYMTYTKEMRISGKLSDKAWESFREMYEPMMFCAKERRREREDSAIRRSRRTMLNGLYDAYKMTIEPSQWKYLPSIDVISCLQPFRELVLADANEAVTEASFAACMNDLPGVLEAASADLQKRVLSRLQPIRAPERTALTLELVEHSFICTAGPFNRRCGQALYGWDEISSHHCTLAKLDVGASPLDSPTVGIFADSRPCFLEQLPYDFSYGDGSRREYALLVAEISGLKPKDATVAEMDDLDLRYTCLQCNKERGKAVAYTWRGCIKHLQEQHFEKLSSLIMQRLLHSVSMKKTFVPLKAADADCVKANERELERGPESKWACTHCPAHLTHSIQYNDVIQHVRETHAIENPEEVVDLIPFRRMRKDYAIEYEPTS